MKIYMREKEIVSLITSDYWMMHILKTAQSLGLPNWCVCKVASASDHTSMKGRGMRGLFGGDSVKVHDKESRKSLHRSTS